MLDLSTDLAIKKLTDAGIDSNDARIEVEDFFRASSNVDEFNSFIERRVKGEPAAYILGVKSFYKSDFLVSPGVLIPRSDTEILVEAALKFLRCLVFPMGDILKVPDTMIHHDNDEIRVLDLCTGTGCVGISIHKELVENRRKNNTTLVDVSDEALSCSRSNIEGIDNISVLKCDVLNQKLVESSFEKESFDVITSNPPYIDSQDMNELDDTVKNYEPELALFGGEDGMRFYDVIAKEAMMLLKDGGALIVEHGYNQGERVADCFKKCGFSNVMTLKDFGGNDRVTLGVK